MNAAPNLKKFRKELGMSQQDLANLLEIHRVSYASVESGKHPLSTKMVKKLVSIANKKGKAASYEYFFGENEDQKQEIEHEVAASSHWQKDTVRQLVFLKKEIERIIDKILLEDN